MPKISRPKALLGSVSSLSTQLCLIAEIPQCKCVIPNSCMILMNIFGQITAEIQIL
jgi:hypothetical protein